METDDELFAHMVADVTLRVLEDLGNDPDAIHCFFNVRTVQADEGQQGRQTGPCRMTSPAFWKSENLGTCRVCISGFQFFSFPRVPESTPSPAIAEQERHRQAAESRVQSAG